MEYPPNADGTYNSPLLLSSGELDLSKLRAHCREYHREAPRRSNIDLAIWHVRQHHRLHLSHIHRGPIMLLRDRRGRRPVGVNPCPLGWYTGQEAVPRAEFRPLA